MIESLEAGNEVLAGAGSAPHLTWSPLAVQFMQDFPPWTSRSPSYLLVFDDRRSLMCTQDQLLMRSEGTFAFAGDLLSGDKLLDQNGNDVQIVEARFADYFGGFLATVANVRFARRGSTDPLLWNFRCPLSAMSGTSDRVLFVEAYSPLPSIKVFSAGCYLGGADALIRSIEPDEERLPCWDWPRQDGVDGSSAVTKN